LGQSSRLWPRVWPLAWAASLAVLPALVQAADPLPASVRACAAVTDVLQRLACYDREVARYPAPAARSAPTAAPATPTSQTAAPASQSAPMMSSPAPQAAAKVSTPPAADSDSQHIVAHVVSIERVPNEMIIHLDNGQVWQEVQSVPGDLSLRDGDAIKIDKHFGSNWLSGPHVSSMKVHQKS